MRIALVLSIALAAAAPGARAGEDPHARFRSTMDQVFGAGTWRVTGGYRTPERENQLRAQGALTVPAGRLSRHSMGRPEAPGAYDVVVEGMSPFRAAAKLRRAGAPFRTIFAEGRHGTQGPHLHLDPHSGGRGGGPAPGLPWVVAALTPAQIEVNRLHDAALDGDGAAQLALGEVYAQGRLARKDPIDAYVWTALAASNDGADADVRGQAEEALATLTARMSAADLEDARRFVDEAEGGASYGPVIARPSAVQAVRVAETGALRLVVASSAP
ncbi:MAG: hypothetical protein Q8Q88_20925 [Phenylobacterium sp.]|uniref:hypothetical protein n=1 Tax=Phenylobacterium sp. TaxID=1871053 RepID=UPI002734A381|nr:hypothetical protein [Phenylobacterium sp.]MDP3749506.1 hypothetical protein [Phenylobacterium sp.]